MLATARIYIDHDVMHGATFPVYEWQRFLTHPFLGGSFLQLEHCSTLYVSFLMLATEKGLKF